MKADAGFVAEVREDEGCWVVALAGELDVASVPDLEDRLDEVVLERPRVVVVDMAEVTFIDSTGLGGLVRSARRVERVGAPLVLRAPGPTVRRVLRLTGVERMLLIED